MGSNNCYHIGNAVREFERRYIGGEKFFNALDEFLRTEYFIRKVYKAIPRPLSSTLLLTGKFGDKMAMWLDDEVPEQLYVLFSGGVRTDKCVSVLDVSAGPNSFAWPVNSTTSAVFVDDSFYSGGTRRAILAELKLDPWVDSYVLYDGSPIVHPFLWSAYRYHNGS